MAINLFPARVAIGRGVDSSGKEIDILMTVEFSRALADVLQRIGGANGLSNDDLSVIGALYESPAVVDDHAGAIAQASQDGLVSMVSSLRKEVEMLRIEIAAITSAVPTRQNDDLLVLLGMAKEPATLTKNTVTGSRAGNAALASLLSALANTGLVTDSTTV